MTLLDTCFNLTRSRNIMLEFDCHDINYKFEDCAKAIVQEKLDEVRSSNDNWDMDAGELEYNVEYKDYKQYVANIIYTLILESYDTGVLLH